MCWNVRNLTARMQRQGRTGGGIELNERIKFIESFIKNANPDVAILLEPGIDGEDIAGRFQGSSIFYTKVSRITKDETYIAFIKRNIVLESQKIIPEINKTQEKYRGGWLLQFSDPKINIVALHAPSPSYSLDTRIDVIGNIANQVPKMDISTLFVGDFNIQGDDIPVLQNLMHTVGFLQVGIAEPTSLRTHRTIINTLDSQSQPYDLVWGRNLRFNKTEATVLHPALTSFNKSIGSEIPNLILDDLRISLLDFDTRLINENVISTRSGTTIISIEEKQHLLKNLDGLVESLKKLLNELDDVRTVILFPGGILQYISYIAIYKEASGRINKYRKALAETNFGAQTFRQKMATINTINNLLTVAINFASIARNANHQALALISFEYAISDHLPVMFTGTNYADINALTIPLFTKTATLSASRMVIEPPLNLSATPRINPLLTKIQKLNSVPAKKIKPIKGFKLIPGNSVNIRPAKADISKFEPTGKRVKME